MRRRLLFAGFAAFLVGANLLAFGSRLTVDLTPNRRFTLQPESVLVAQRLPAPTRVEVFLPSASRLGREAKLLLERYASRAHDLRYDFVDPRTEAARLLKEQVEPGQAVAVHGDRRIVAESLSEQDVTSAFLRLIRKESKTVCFTTGHGEREIGDPGPGGLAVVAAALKGAGYEVLALPAGTSVAPGCDAIAVAGPKTAFAPPEAEAFGRWMQEEGKGVVMADPPAYEAASELAEPWGVRVLRGLVVDPAQSLQQDPLAPVVARYPSFNPAVAELDAATVWPQTAGLSGGGLVPETGIYVSTLAVSGPGSWLETGGAPGFQKDADRRGPVLVAASADESRLGGRERRVPSERGRVIRTRLLVWGSVNVASNAFVGLLGNSRLVLDGFAWLAQDEELIGLVPKAVSPAGVVLTSSRRRALLWWSIGLPVAVAVGAGAAAWTLRRN